MSKIFVLSLPKSGTYMWSNILEQSGYKFCGKHIAYSGFQNIPDDRQQFFEDPMGFYVKSPLADSLKFIDDGEFAVGHLPCTPETIDMLKDFKLIFSYRDLKESIVSFINYAGKFQINRGKQWSDESTPNALRIELFFRSDAAEYIKLVNSTAGWKSFSTAGKILKADYRQVINFDSQFIKQAADFFEISGPEVADIIQQAINAPSFTKIENKLKQENGWSDVSNKYYDYYGLGNVNRRLGFDQYEISTLQKKVKKAAIICNPQFIHYNYVHNYLRSFEEYKDGYEVEYIPVQMMGETSVAYDFSNYSLIVVTFHIRPWLARWGNIEFESALYRFEGTKVLLLHDEYDETDALKKWIQDFRINHVFSVIPQQYLHKVYPVDRFPDCEFHSNFTAYVSSDIPEEITIPPICLRKMDIVYRGRAASPWHGELAREKYEIGEYFKSLDHYDLRMDLDSQENERIYGDAWLQFLMSARATLGTESGSNVFDVDGSIRQWFESNPQNEDGTSRGIPDELNFKEMNLGVEMNQISPKIFEAISCKTALILYEGEYSGVLTANVHYIELKKDHSNIDDVIQKVSGCDYLQKLVDTAYEDIIESGAYSYRAIMNKIYSTNVEYTVKNCSAAEIYQKGLNFNNLVNNQLAEKTALLKASASRVQVLDKRYTNYKNNVDKKVENLKVAIEKLKSRIEKLKMYNSRYQAKIVILEKFKQDQENKLSWKVEKKIERFIGKAK